MGLGATLKRVLPGQSTPPGLSGSLDADVVFEMLSSPRRCSVVRYVDRNGETTLDELAVAIACEEYDETPQTVSNTQRKRVYVSVYQSHLPKLDGHAIVEYNDRSGAVRPGANLGQCAALLEQAAD